MNDWKWKIFNLLEIVGYFCTMLKPRSFCLTVSLKVSEIVLTLWSFSVDGGTYYIEINVVCQIGATSVIFVLIISIFNKESGLRVALCIKLLHALMLSALTH